MAKLIKGPNKTYGLLIDETELECMYIIHGASSGGPSLWDEAGDRIFEAVSSAKMREKFPDVSEYFDTDPRWKKRRSK